MSRRRRHSFLIFASIALLVALFFGLSRGSDDREELSFNEFSDLLDDGSIKTAELKERDSKVEGELHDGVSYEAAYAAEFADELLSELNAAEPSIEITVDQQKESFWFSLLLSLLPIVLLVGLFLFIINSMQGGGSRLMKFGKSKARQVDKNQPKVTFADVAGCDEAVEELREIKDFLSDPGKFHAVGAKIPKGVLLYGPPGTGKTLLARAVAGEANVPFFTISGSDFVEMFVGVGASRVRDLFEQAKSSAPAIIFVDEIDAVGRHRGAGVGGGHDEREQTLNQMLVEMDGFDVSTGVIMIAATNRPDILDPALLRPGRFDRQIVVDLPNLNGRRAILDVHIKGKPISDDVSTDLIARRTPGFTGADLANLLNEAALLAARRDRAIIGTAEIADSIDRVMAGPERKSTVMSDEEKRVIAYHEAGHALVGHVLSNTDPIHKVSIIARGRALGWTLSLPTEDRHLHTLSQLTDELAMMLGGRTAEEVVFGDPTTGAANDIERATEVARSMVTEYGMSEELGLIRFGNPHNEIFLGKEMGHEASYSEEIASTIDSEVHKLIEIAHTEARDVLTQHRETLDRLAEALIEVETLEEDELDAIYGHLEPWEGSATTPSFGFHPPALSEPTATELDQR